MKANQLGRPQKTFFFEREDGSRFFVGEREAWGVYKNHNQIIGQMRTRNKIVGVSNGQKFHEAVAEAHKMYLTDPEGAKARLKQGEEEEWESAKGNIEIPRDFDTIGQNGQPVRIQDLR